MKSYLKCIAVIDKKDKVHYVQFNSGVNVITGKSSTGKSAMIEIFDYCFGKGESTIPAGVITDNAKLYFVIINLNSINLVLARKVVDKKRAFLKEEGDTEVLNDIGKLGEEYFNSDYFITISDFRVELGRYFGLDIYSVDEDLELKEYRRNQAKKPRPSVRHFTSFMMQHQSMVANKHAIFYRFDEKEKREQTIEQFKIFAGFVDQKYFIKKEQLNDKERELKQLQYRQKNIDKNKDKKSKLLDELLKAYLSITGRILFKENGIDILKRPAHYLEILRQYKIDADYDSDEHIKQLNSLNKKRNSIEAERRDLQHKLAAVVSSIDYAKEYKNQLYNTAVIDQVPIKMSQCPFCKTKNEVIADEANRLEDAINWLNNELRQTPYFLDSFLSEKRDIEKDIQESNFNIKEVQKKINSIKAIVDKLNINKSLEEQGLQLKLKIENLIEDVSGEYDDIENEIKEKEDEINSIKRELSKNYNVEKNLLDAEKQINKEMQKIGKQFDFEESYKPINLKFSVRDFNLFHQDIKDRSKKIFLRSMGSGANWLYSHLTLFMSLHKYFCFLGDKCLIPPILFIDQPSQVYFPSNIDFGEKFTPEDLKEKEGKKEETDEDLKAVTNIYNQLVKFCKETLMETGIEPQIIVTDHADNLKLKEVEFEHLVNHRRWRKQGFIRS